MADFRKLSKGNPLKPGRVAIPQLDPLTEVEAQDQGTEQEPESNHEDSTVAAQGSERHVPVPQPEPDDLDSYKRKHLRKEDEKVTKTFRMYKWRYEQLDREVRDTGLSQWQIIDIGLEMYFRDKERESSDPSQ